MTVGERIKKIRLEKGLTQKQVADSCGMADSAIRKYESGQITPKFETIQRIALALEVNPGELMGLIDYGDNIWGPPDMSQGELDEIRLRALKIKANQSELQRIKERIAKKDHIVGKLELLNDTGLDIVLHVVDAVVGNSRLSTYPPSPPYRSPQSTPAPPEGKDTAPSPDAPETPPEGE